MNSDNQVLIEALKVCKEQNLLSEYQYNKLIEFHDAAQRALFRADSSSSVLDQHLKELHSNNITDKTQFWYRQYDFPGKIEDLTEENVIKISKERQLKNGKVLNNLHGLLVNITELGLQEQKAQAANLADQFISKIDLQDIEDL